MKRDIGIVLGEEKEYRGQIYKGFIVLILALLALRMFYLQVMQKDKYEYLAQKNRVKMRKKDAKRGNIYDASGELLVTNTKGYRLVYMNKREISDETLEEIVTLTGLEKEYLKKRIKYGELVPYTKENILIDDLQPDIAHKLLEKISDYPYLEVQQYAKRKYIYDTLASHTIGYVKKISKKEYEALKDKGYTPRDVIGKSGIEKTYDEELKGRPGYEYIEVNALNRVQKIEKTAEADPGYDLHLSIDMRLQSYMEEVFKEGGYKGAMVALDPRTGKVITIVSYPTYPLSQFSSKIPADVWKKISTDPRRVMTNKSIAGEYPPGSTFKPFSAFSFFKKGLSPSATIYDNGVFRLGNSVWRAWKHGGHGTVDFNKSIVESVNPYYYTFANKYGYKGIVKSAGDFGYGKETGIDVPGEKTGILPDEKWKKKRFKQPWFKGDTINFSIGQGYMLATPIQVAVSYMGLANKGKAYAPRVVDYMVKGDKREEIKPQLLYDVSKDYPKWYFKVLNRALINTVESSNGTTRALITPGVVIGAKSGSAQNSAYRETHAWVAGYFPADSQPKVVFTVLLEGAGGGGHVAGGVAKKFVDKYLELHRDEYFNNKKETKGKKKDKEK